MVRGGDGEAFLALLEPIRDGLYRFTLRNMWRKDYAADTLQEAITVAWSQFDRFEKGTNFRAWMFKILLNTIYRHNRRAARTQEVEASAPINDGSVSDGSAWLSILEEPRRVREALDDRIVAALEQLAPVERQCFLLRLLEDFSYKEIAELLSVPMGTVMSHVFRARTKLRDRLANMAPLKSRGLQPARTSESDETHEDKPRS